MRVRTEVTSIYNGSLEISTMVVVALKSHRSFVFACVLLPLRMRTINLTSVRCSAADRSVGVG